MIFFLGLVLGHDPALLQQGHQASLFITLHEIILFLGPVLRHDPALLQPGHKASIMVTLHEKCNYFLLGFVL